MNVEVLKNAGIDYDFGVKRFAGRAHLYEKALTKFSGDTTFSRISASYEADDRDALLSSAHELKGVCGNIGLTSLYEASDAIVGLIRSGAFPPDELDVAYELLRTRYERIHDAIVASLEVI